MVNATVEGILETTQITVSKVIEGVAILLIGFAIGLLAKKVLYRVLKEIEINKIMSKVGISSKLDKGISSIVSYVIYLITVVLFLNRLGIRSIVLYIVVGAILMLIILTFLVGLKDIIPNFMAWIILQRKKNIRVGTRIEVKNINGHVEKIGYLETEIKTDQGDILYVPNSLFLKSKVWVRK
jgi:small conductance mechanosensitive channel